MADPSEQQQQCCSQEVTSFALYAIVVAYLLQWSIRGFRNRASRRGYYLVPP